MIFQSTIGNIKFTEDADGSIPGVVLMARVGTAVLTLWLGRGVYTLLMVNDAGIKTLVKDGSTELVQHAIGSINW